MTRYADRLLASGERVALRGRQHILATIIEGRLAWAIFIASLVLLILIAQLEPGTPEPVRQGFSILALVLLLVGLVWLTGIYLDWYNQDYVVTNRRVMKVEGILSKRSADSSLEKINDAVLEQSILGRMLGYGDLDILTANETSVDKYRMLSEAQTFKRTMLDEKHKLEQDVFQIPAPPLRAAPAGAASAGVPAGASSGSVPATAMAGTMTATASTEPIVTMGEAATGAGDPGGNGSAVSAPAVTTTPQPAAAAAMSSDEITRALGDLADLRDRGAISPEEYEAKKQDLLGRL